MEKVWTEVRGDKKKRPHYKLESEYCPRGRRFFIKPYGIDRWKITSSKTVNSKVVQFDLVDDDKNLRLYTNLKKAKQTAKRIADAARLGVG